MKLRAISESPFDFELCSPDRVSWFPGFSALSAVEFQILLVGDGVAASSGTVGRVLEREAPVSMVDLSLPLSVLLAPGRG